MLEYVIPVPKEVVLKEGSFELQDNLTLFYTSDVERIAEMLARDWPCILKKVDLPLKMLFLGNQLTPLTQKEVRHKEGYTLDITSDGVQITALSYRGIYYGYTTLLQIMEDVKSLPAVSIYDYPDLDMRGMHFDLKGAMPTVEYINQCVKLLGRYKINTILMEYEDKFPYEKYPQIKAPGALTVEELDTIMNTARDCGIEVIPLLQCLGHTEYILRHDEFAQLGENGMRQMLCPLKPGSLELIKSLIDEILPYHADSRYFHMGADEAWLLGYCPECSAYAARHGRARLYVDYVKQVAAYIASKGKKPVLWDDMFYKEKGFELIEDLPSNVVLNLWDYDATEEETPYVRWNSRAYVSKQWIDRYPAKIAQFGAWLEDLPEDEQYMIKKYKSGDKYPLMGHPFPWMKKYLEEGCEVIGASAAKGAGRFSYNSLFPDFKKRFMNTLIWAKRAKEAGITGVISTAWSKYSTAAPPTESWESAMYNYIASAENYWNSNSTKESFDRRFSMNYLGANTKITKAMDYLEQGRLRRDISYLKAAELLLTETKDVVVKHSVFVDILLNALHFEMLSLSIDNQFWEVQPWLYYSFSKDALRQEVNNEAKIQLNSLKERLLQWQEDSISLYKSIMSATEAEELVKTKAAGKLAFIETLVNKL